MDTGCAARGQAWEFGRQLDAKLAPNLDDNSP